MTIVEPQQAIPGATAADPLLEVVRRTWGFDTLRPLQRESMEAIRGGRDSLVVLPTGGGKSLCFQAPALLGDGVAVVVSPLISLMKDQVDGLVVNGVAAAAYNSSLDGAERTAVRQGLTNGRYRLLYVSPERLAGDSGEGFCRLLDQARVAFFAVDEAHCISQWGHAFRPEYRALGGLRRRFPGASVHAFTATATPRVRRDIVEQLGLADPEVLVGSFDRPNLTYRVLRRGNLAASLRRVIDRHADEAGIIYCRSRKETESLAERLGSWGYSARAYHAGLDDATRARHQEEFLNERVDIMVATVAFGMGIDRSNVRFLIHTGSPRSIEHYQQEAGRAGRDGLEAECVLFYSAGDFVTWRRLLDESGELDDSARRLLAEMRRYAGATHCRHRALLEYFGEVYERDDCGACDWCLGELERVDEPLELAQKILSCVYRLRQRWGAGQVIDVLRGRMSDKVEANGHHELSTFGLLEDLSIDELRGFIGQLLDQGFLHQAGDRYPVLQATADGHRLLKGEASCALFRQQRPEPRRSRKPAVADAESWEGVDRGLFDELRELRREIAAERGVPPYVIFHDTSLRDLARVRPASRATLLEVYGVGEKKADDLGPKFLELIERYCTGGDLARDVPRAAAGRSS